MPKYSTKLNVQLLAEVFLAYGIEHIVLSPGSRNGALATHFSHHQAFKTYSIVDERSAGFVALGMAQQLKKPVVLCCTSGSAVANYYPAVTEAFYQNIPLIILSADRPSYLIDQFDGQTIRQKKIFKKHSYAYTQITEDESTEGLTKNLHSIKKVITKSFRKSGPVHINMPMDEPLYDFKNELAIHIDSIKKSEYKENEINTSSFAEDWNNTTKKLVLVGLQYPNDELNDLLIKLSEDNSVVILTEVNSNLHHQRFFNKIDPLIFSLSNEKLATLKPDVLLTIGQNVVSKKIKSFLRTHQPKAHWHLNEFWQPNTYQCLNKKIKVNAIHFLRDFVPLIKPNKSDYYTTWNTIRREKEKNQTKFSSETSYSDFKVFETLIASIPNGYDLHYSNSSAIRYAQLFKHNSSINVYCNRGASGIDGSTSTAIGSAMVSHKKTVLITGDIAFFYDSNALWNNYIPNHFKIILINNGGGNIFKIIPGPEDSGVIESVFETKHKLNASHLAKMFNFNYTLIESLEDLQKKLASFFNDDSPNLMEINTSNIDNATILRSFFRTV